MAAFSRTPIFTLASLAAFLTAIYNFLTIFYGPLDVFLLVLFSLGRLANFLLPLPNATTTLRNACALSAGVCVLALFVILPIQAVRARPNTTKQWSGPGKVLLFPSRTSHARQFPQKHAFAYSYLTVGIPVGFEGNAGGMVSVKAADTSASRSWWWWWWWSFLASPSSGWFTVDAGDHLARGNSRLGLRGKLDAYLQSQGVQPARYPHAYLLTAPRIFGYHFNPVSFWYLYDAGQRLAAVILEVNNTFGERRMYLLTEPTPGEQQQLECPPPEQRRRHIFKQSWPKDFHVSPFSSRKGSYTLTTTDPLPGTAPPRIAITLHSSKSHPKLFASLSPAGSAIDPAALTPAQKLRFLASWWCVGFLTHPRILCEAGLLYFRRGLKVWYRPEPLRGTVSRRATATEARLEAVFRRFLEYLVERVEQRPLVVRYIPAGGESSTAEVVMCSPGVGKRDTGVDDELEIRVLTPRFYAHFAASADSYACFTSEYDNDNNNRTVDISRPELLANLLGKSQPRVGKTDPCFRLIQFLRRQNNITPTDESSKMERAERPSRVSSLDAYVLAVLRVGVAWVLSGAVSVWISRLWMSIPLKDWWCL